MTVCNMSIEMGARGGMIAPDEVTFEYLKDREFSPKGRDWAEAVERWSALRSGSDAVVRCRSDFDAAEIEPMITYGNESRYGGRGVGVYPAGGGSGGEIPRFV